VGIAAALNGLAVVARSGGDDATARTMYREAIAIQEEVGDEAGLTRSLNYLGVLLWGQGECEEARAVLERALVKAADDTRHTASALAALGYVRHEQGQHGAAAELLREAHRLYAELGHVRGEAKATWALARATAGQGDTAQAQALFLACAVRFGELGDRFFVSWCLDGLAGIALAWGQPRAAAQLLGAAQATLEAIGAARLAVGRGAYERSLAAARDALGEADLAAALAVGRTLAPARALEIAREMGEPPRPAAAPPDAVCPATPPPRGGELSAREREVARLIARGLTNRQIAAALTIAEGTADRHVSNILGKLGFAARAQVAAWTVEHAV
jgi:non-specific serine/threonine protein kinase